MTDGDVALVIEALYQMAADPDQWRQVIDSMADQPPRELAPESAERSLRHTETVARLAAACEPSFAPEPAMEIGWVVIDSRRRVLPNQALRAGASDHRIRRGPGLLARPFDHHSG